MRFVLAFFVLALTIVSFAQTKKVEAPETLPKYQIGSGANYQLLVGKDPVDVTIGFVQQTPNKLVLEMVMKSETEKESHIQMVQQFQLGIEAGKIKILKGIMKIPMIEKPQILPPEFLQGYAGGVQVKSFLINSKSDMLGKKVGVESVVTPTRTYSATHYRQEENGQIVDYWISEEASPLGLVRMASVGKGATQSYKMVLKGPVTGVKAQINEADAEPLNDVAKAFLPLIAPGINQH